MDAAVTDDLTELAERCRAGDAIAMRQLVERLHRPVLSLCLRMMAHYQDAEDAAQESLVRMVRYLDGWDRSRAFVPWVMAIAANRCRTARQKRRQQATSQPLVHEVEGRVPAHSNGDIAPLVQQALQQLRDDYRVAFILFHIENLSIADVSDSLQVPTGTVKVWLHRARKELADILRTLGVQPGDGS